MVAYYKLAKAKGVRMQYILYTVVVVNIYALIKAVFRTILHYKCLLILSKCSIVFNMWIIIKSALCKKEPHGLLVQGKFPVCNWRVCLPPIMQCFTRAKTGWTDWLDWLLFVPWHSRLYDSYYIPTDQYVLHIIYYTVNTIIHNIYSTVRTKEKTEITHK